MIPQKYHHFVDGQVEAGKITAYRLNENWDRLFRMFNPAEVGISEDNLATTSHIVSSDRTIIITGVWTFYTNPVFNSKAIPESAIDVSTFVVKVAGYIPDADIPTTIPRKATAEAISGSWSFSSIEPVIKSEASLPETVVAGKVIRYQDDLYHGKSGVWKKLLNEATDMTTFGIKANDANMRNHNDAEQSTESAEAVKLKETTINEAVSGTITLSIVGYVPSGYGTAYFAKNGVMLGDAFSITGSQAEPEQNFLQNLPITLVAGDKLQVYGYRVTSLSLTVYQFGLHFDRAISHIGGKKLATSALLTLDTSEQSALDVTNNL